MVINNNYGPQGSNLFYYLRGAAPKYTTIQIDGIPVADPSGITTFFDLNNLSLDQIERIEILRGAASTLHGSGAVAGVRSQEHTSELQSLMRITYPVLRLTTKIHKHPP